MYHQQQQPLHLNYNENPLSKIRNIVTFICFFLFWIFLLSILSLSAVSFEKNKGLIFALIFLCSVCYIVYIILEFCSRSYEFFSSIENFHDLTTELNEIYQGKVELKFHFESYSYRTTIQYNAYTKTNESAQEIVTNYMKDKLFEYKYSVDISDKDVLNQRNNIYTILQLEYEYFFYDEATLNDFEQQKQAFSIENHSKHTGTYLDERLISNFSVFKEYVYGRLMNKDISFFSKKWFIFFILLGMGVIYKIYINKYILRQKYIIKKLISTRNEINS